MTDTVTAPSRRYASLRIIGLVGLLALGFAWVLHTVSMQRAGGQQIADNVSVLESRLENLEAGVRVHEHDIKDLQDNVQRLASASPATTPSPSAAPAANAENDDRIEKLEKEIATLKTAEPLQDKDKILQSIHLLSNFHHLSSRVMNGKPFAAELSSFEETANPDESSNSPLATLAPYAESGIPTFATLLASFDQAVDSFNIADAVPPSGTGFWQRFKYNIAHLITVRRIDDVQTGTSDTAIIGRAQAHLEREEIEAAMAEIKSLPERERGNFAAWLDDAQIVIEAPSLMDQLEEQVMQKAFYVQPAANAQPTSK